MEIDSTSASILLDFFKLDKILFFILAILFIVVVVRLVNSWSSNLQNKFNAHRLILLQSTTIFSFVAYLFGFLGFFYFIFRPTKEVMVAVGGSAAVAFGFALKDLVGSIIAGFILLFDRPFQVGDRVSFNDTYGEIKSIGLRSVRLQTLDDNLVTIPNSKFLSDIVASGNSGALDMMVIANFHIAINENLEKVKSLLHEIVITSRFVYLEKSVTIVLDEVVLHNMLAIKFSVKAYVLDVKFEKAFVSDIITRGEEVLNQHGIKRPVLT